MNTGEEIYELTRQIPSGRVSTYGAIAEAAADKVAARAVGVALHHNPDLIETPCHRVVHANGDVGGYKLGAMEKIKLLKEEGVIVKNDKVSNFEEKLFNSFRTP